MELKNHLQLMENMISLLIMVATITETKRFDAISNASNKALDEVLSKIAVSSFR
jgi:hypothetical protein